MTLTTTHEVETLALCAREGTDPDDWFSRPDLEPHRALSAARTCRDCSLVVECARRGETAEFGIWGGTAIGATRGELRRGVKATSRIGGTVAELSVLFACSPRDVLAERCSGRRPD